MKPLMSLSRRQFVRRADILLGPYPTTYRPNNTGSKCFSYAAYITGDLVPVVERMRSLVPGREPTRLWLVRMEPGNYIEPHSHQKPRVLMYAQTSQLDVLVEHEWKLLKFEPWQPFLLEPNMVHKVESPGGLRYNFILDSSAR